MEESFVCTWLLILLVSVVLVTYNWKKRWVYYYGLQFPVLSTIPAGLRFARSLHKALAKGLQRLYENRPPVFKIWIANEFYIINSQPEDIDILMNTFYEKNYVYKIWDDFLKNTVLTSPVSVWKGRRREMNRTFNSKILASFHEVFVKNAKRMVKTFEKLCGTEQTEMLFGIWKHNLDAVAETLLDINPASVEKLYEIITSIIRGEQIIMERISKFWLLIDFFFRFSSLHKESKAISSIIETIGRRMVSVNKQQVSNDDVRKKCFLNHMIDWSESSNKMTESELIQETVIMAVAASETTSLATVSVILALGLLSDVQEKVYQEISSILKEDEEPTSEDINRMDYLERVIKETLRILPVVVMMTRSIDKTVKLGSFVYPAGGNLAIPISYIHRRPDIWPDPLKFDPDRFLPEEVAKRHRCSYIPFGFGPRNCIGLKYGMISMKVSLAYIVKNFKIKTLNYRTLEDLEFECYLLAKASGYRVMFERRTGSNS